MIIYEIALSRRLLKPWTLRRRLRGMHAIILGRYWSQAAARRAVARGNANRPFAVVSIPTLPPKLDTESGAPSIVTRHLIAGVILDPAKIVLNPHVVPARFRIARIWS